MKVRNPINLALLALAALLTLSVAIAAAGTTWHALGHFPELKAQEVMPQQSAAIEAPDLAPILALAPFGVPTATQGPIQATSANLILRGVILAVPASRSTALISEAVGEPRTVSVGQTLPGGAVLDSVASDHVMLLLAGRREILAFPETQSAAGVNAIRASIPGANANSILTGQNAPQDVIDGYRQKIADNPQTVLDEFSVSATPEGYRVGQTPAANVRRAGLLPGDLVVRVNGVAVGNVEQDRKHFEDVVASGRARVEVMRNDRLLILSFPLR